jgi:hypothetical protein
MTATERRLDAGPLALDQSSPDLTTGRLRARRQPKWIAAGVLAICLGGLGAAVLYTEAAQSSDVVILTRSVPRGEIVQASDFTVARVGSLTGVSYVSGSAIPGLVGRTALVDLPNGSLLPADSVGTPALVSGSAQVGLKLMPGRIPTGELPQGTPVVLVPLEDTRIAPGQDAALLEPIPATVLTPPRTGSDGVAILLDVRVAVDRSDEVAVLAATDRVALVKKAR